MGPPWPKNEEILVVTSAFWRGGGMYIAYIKFYLIHHVATRKTLNFLTKTCHFLSANHRQLARPMGSPNVRENSARHGPRSVRGICDAQTVGWLALPSVPSKFHAINVGWAKQKMLQQ